MIRYVCGMIRCNLIEYRILLRDSLCMINSLIFDFLVLVFEGKWFGY